MPASSGVDFLDFDSLLSDEEKLARQTARQFVDGRDSPHHREIQSRRKVSRATRSADGGARVFRREPEGLRLRRNVERRVRPGDAGTRARRFRPAQLRFRAVGAGDVSDPRVRLGRAERKMAPAAATGQSHRLLRPDRAAIRLESRRDADARREKGRRLHPERRKNVDHQRLDRRCRARLGEMRRRQNPRLPRRKRHARIQGVGHSRQMFAARIRHFRPLDDRLQNSRRKSASRRRGPERAAFLPGSGALRHRLGRDRRRDGLLRHGPQLREAAQAI